jgi:hypothetical protein
MQCSAHHINPNRSADYSLDRNGADDGTGAIAAIGATGIRPRDGSRGSGPRRREFSNFTRAVPSPANIICRVGKI